ncbi:MAG TPA: hypothetical protein V6C65_11445, partial [Allocoleopsis sp.]
MGLSVLALQISLEKSSTPVGDVAGLVDCQNRTTSPTQELIVANITAVRFSPNLLQPMRKFVQADGSARYEVD